MFLVHDERFGVSYLVFTWADPRLDGYRGTVVPDVQLDYDLANVHSWPDGAARPDAVVGRNPAQPNGYKVFKYASDLKQANFEPVAGKALVFGSWKDYHRLHMLPPDPEQTTDEQWFDYLDRVDSEARERNQRAPQPDEPTSANRDDVAAWVAKKHLIVDPTIREVRYLPSHAPDEEIRLLELSDRLVMPDTPAYQEPHYSRLEHAGKNYRIAIADVSSVQFERMQLDPAQLPHGWSFNEQHVWKRGHE